MTFTGPISAAPLAVLRGQRRSTLVALGAILAVAALLYTWNLGYSGLSTYYAAAARSMSRNWHAFAFGALDPGAHVTLDKLSGFLVPQAVSVYLFGFHAWALSLPQAIEGVATVYCAYVVGTRWRGAGFGLAAATLMTVTPMLAAMFGRPMEDGMLTMTMVLAFVCLQRAMLTNRIGWLVGAGAWVAVGFQAKMLQAWLILPALAVGYLIASREPLRRRVGKLVAVGAVTVVLSLGWITAIQAVPATDRPYIDGSTNNNVYSMVFGYNGVDRILPGIVPGAVPQLGHAATGPAQKVNHTATSDAGHSIAKLVLPQFTTQIGWLYPTAIAGAALGLIAAIRHRKNSDRVELATIITLTVWIAVTGAVLSVAFVPHATYFAVIALPLALLACLGGMETVRLYLSHRGRSWIPLVATLAAQTAWTGTIILSAPPVLRWIAIPVALFGGGAAIAFFLFRSRSPSRRTLLTLSGAAACAVLIAPVLWSACVIAPGGGGSASDAFAGPRVTAAHAPAVHAKIGSLRPPWAAPTTPGLSADQSNLLAYLQSRTSGQNVLFATDTMAIAVSFTLYSHYEVLPMGGFSRQSPNLSPQQLRADIADGSIRFVLLSDSTQGAPPNAILSATRRWVTGTCSAKLTGHYREGSQTTQTLWECRA
ncbi:glycosyltransferase family 39 protein [Glaciihabitans sp. UYNi722]|uniref:ArnT family glycosyltransferase n=1 Tax=Glaciihabitans sp. UYNi722 TaxID=3156344 RepID=UPI00339AC899